jgi:hypothetical protein
MNPAHPGARSVSSRRTRPPAPNPKITVKDARGETWDVKFDEEVHAEVAANRLVWALGYNVEDHYFVREGVVAGASGLGRAAKHLGPDGAFKDARFRWRNPAAPRTEEEWTLQRNPFVGSRELSGLYILMTMIKRETQSHRAHRDAQRAIACSARATAHLTTGRPDN